MQQGNETEWKVAENKQTKKLKQIIKYNFKNLHLHAIICWRQCHERIKVGKRILNVPFKENQFNVFSSNAFLRKRK